MAALLECMSGEQIKKSSHQARTPEYMRTCDEHLGHKITTTLGSHSGVVLFLFKGERAVLLQRRESRC